ncbi:hypothetical protein B0A48_15194 [Cryoendolithus antarcticus]|uniref:Uncharacterized protein n=1 Tax=Cryoendolithus antarcticus TaxID=1507870 RepID=A0A1V8SI85_9PEZI|nr:hypothetical protein B0A48_15194 [Cryoendolithus antarcticus]
MLSIKTLTLLASTLLSLTSGAALPDAEPNPIDPDVAAAAASACTTAKFNELMFTDSLKTFQSARAAKNPSKCDWSSDECSNSPDNPDGFHFKPFCERYDFGYQNSHHLGIWNKDMKSRIDSNYYDDLKKVCKDLGGLSVLKKPDCYATAWVYYETVKAFGG